MHPDEHESSAQRPGGAGLGRTPWYWRPSVIVVLVSLATIAAYYLWTEHRAHVLALLPYALLLFCPLMHVLHHGRHKHGGG